MELGELGIVRRKWTRRVGVAMESETSQKVPEAETFAVGLGRRRTLKRKRSA
jgi:hypothetical protein